MYHKILVPLDRSKRAEAILPHVESLARHYEATIIFLGIIEPLYIGHTSIYDNPLFDQHNLQMQTEAMEQYLQTRQEEFQEKGLKVERRVGHGQIMKGITQAAQEEDVDLVAMTSHGHTGLARVFYGSVTAGVLHSLDRPILVIRSLE